MNCYCLVVFQLDYEGVKEGACFIREHEKMNKKMS